MGCKVCMYVLLEVCMVYVCLRKRLDEIDEKIGGRRAAPLKRAPKITFGLDRIVHGAWAEEYGCIHLHFTVDISGVRC